MKKILSVATTSALTLSLMSAPVAIVSAAETVTDSFSIVMQDQKILKGVSSVKIPVSFDKDVSFTSAKLKFSARIHPNGSFTANIKGIQSALSADSGVTVTQGDKNSGIVNLLKSDGKDYKAKKGEVLFYLNVDFQLNGQQATAIPEGTVFRVSLDDFDVADENGVAYELSDAVKKNTASYVQVIPEKLSENISVSFDSVTAIEKTVKVPIKLKGSMSSFRSKYSVDNGAKITSIEIEAGKDFTEDMIIGENVKDTLTYLNGMGADYKFDDTIAYINIALPENAVSGQSFTLSANYFDPANEADVPEFPSKNISSDIIYVLKGDIDLNNALKQVDATQVLKESLSMDMTKKSILGDMYTKKAESSPEIKETIEKFGLDRLVEAGRFASDINADGKVSAVDATFILRYLLAVDMNGSDYSWDDFFAK